MLREYQKFKASSTLSWEWRKMEFDKIWNINILFAFKVCVLSSTKSQQVYKYNKFRFENTLVFQCLSMLMITMIVITIIIFVV